MLLLFSCYLLFSLKIFSYSFHKIFSYSFHKIFLQNLTLKDREWICPACETKLDRDLNASENILEQGLRLSGEALNQGLMIYNSGCGMQSESKQKREEALSLDEPTSHETQGSLVLG